MYEKELVQGVIAALVGVNVDWQSKLTFKNEQLVSYIHIMAHNSSIPQFLPVCLFVPLTLQAPSHLRPSNKASNAAGVQEVQNVQRTSFAVRTTESCWKAK